MKEKVKFKIGQEVEAQQDFELQGHFGEETIQVKAGSKGVVTARGFLLHTTGATRGKLQHMSEEAFEIKGYEHENIAKMIYDRLITRYPLKDFLEDYEIEEDEVIENIEDVLSDIF